LKTLAASVRVFEKVLCRGHLHRRGASESNLLGGRCFWASTDSDRPRGPGGEEDFRLETASANIADRQPLLRLLTRSGGTRVGTQKKQLTGKKVLELLRHPPGQSEI